MPDTPTFVTAFAPFVQTAISGEVRMPSPKFETPNRPTAQNMAASGFDEESGEVSPGSGQIFP